ncbi:hypothetical protein AXG93_638s1230 [Marchantia polymorpha subsp. ruderalis]|uniref:Uncharacterized protein n=1 Tax=Marchantia polymorpha subsp. ruderalis TaxID=1480154 RepID=A0A176W6Y0_MARPO|nr:hypothetical protein AXG93_638s1230 [Marchantia polymorpha subsp. ruderalis]
MLVLPASNAETGRAAEGNNSPSSREDRSPRTVERSVDLPVPKSRTPWAEARRPPDQEKQHATPTNVPAADRCFPSEQVPFADSILGNSGQEPLAQGPSGEPPSAEAQREKIDEGEEGKTRVPLAQPPSAQASSAVDAFGAAALVATDQAGGAGLLETGFPTALDILAGSSAAAIAAEAEATQPNSWESPGNSVATEILNSEDDGDESGSDEEEEQSVKGTPTTALCEQVAPLLRYLDRKVAKRTRTKVRISSLLASLDEDIKDLRLKNEALRGHLAIVRKLQKVVNKTRDEKFEDAKKEFAKQQAKLADELDFEQTQNRIL